MIPTNTATEKNVAITGASSGLGEAIALELSKPGVRLHLCARRKPLLADVARRCRERGAKTEISRIDVRKPGVVKWINDIDEKSAIDVLIVNSGMFGGKSANGQLEASEVAQDIINTNLNGAILAASEMARRMCRRGSGKIVLISSLAAVSPLPDAPAYTASKAGLSAYGEALREYALPYGVKVVTVHPGHFESKQTEMQSGWMPMLLSSQEAAKIIVEGLAKNKTNISFPFRLRALVWLNNLLPWRLRAITGSSLRFHVRD